MLNTISAVVHWTDYDCFDVIRLWTVYVRNAIIVHTRVCNTLLTVMREFQVKFQNCIKWSRQKRLWSLLSSHVCSLFCTWILSTYPNFMVKIPREQSNFNKCILRVNDLENCISGWAVPTVFAVYTLIWVIVDQRIPSVMYYQSDSNHCMNK